MEHRRFDEAVAQFRRLGEHADARLWGYSRRGAKGEFRPVRRLACTGATRP
ncbi:hypothetical protein [Amycolatopsis saalfeldensis]|uniref:Uncharacterized protein n=1 Tax=Amycolatopsis saalfeldensis TaxID=394193 RepID=A0A1H8YLA2_9PSEU|nr:hypothetical protein [Amycolatopsis saalfeldensis]SEP52940.1 hypothetical protein SAMN04489732_12366 [Amycolatopsis saalfeldensis]